MNDIVGSMSSLMESPWFYVVVAFFVLLAITPLLATRLLAQWEDRRKDRPKSERGGERKAGDPEAPEERNSD